MLQLNTIFANNPNGNELSKAPDFQMQCNFSRGESKRQENDRYQNNGRHSNKWKKYEKVNAPNKQ